MADYTSEISSGIFSPVHPQDFFRDEAPLDKNFYTFCILRMDDNGNGVFDQNETWYDGLNGEVRITGSGNRFKVIIDTDDPFSAKSVNGAYDGVFQVEE